MFEDVPKNNKNLILLTEESEYSVMKKNISKKIIEIILNLDEINKNSIIIDGNAHVGGLTIELGKIFNTIYAFELNKKTCKCLQSNIKAYELNNIKVKCKSIVNNYIKADIIIFDPPWGGYNYKKNKYLDLFLDNINIIDIILEWKQYVKYVLLYVPYNYNINTVFSKNINFTVFYLQLNKIKSHKLIII
jgi:predicted RNA methylase